MSLIDEVPEVRELDRRSQLVRLPDALDVPLTDRVRRLVDTAEFHRLSQISQLGLVRFVYPGAVHSRFEHSLGVYRNALLFVRKLSHDAIFTNTAGVRQIELFLAAALLHDIGHWPFCHPMEDMGVPEFGKHERTARQLIEGGPIARLLAEDWNIDADKLLGLLTGDDDSAGCMTLGSMLSGPIDVDKTDYLYRDSLHAGVPYGRNFDVQRLIGSLCVDPDTGKLAITDKGRTAAEMMVFARYVMFSEVYWHHAVRSATAMFQRAMFLLRNRLDMPRVATMTEQQMITCLLDICSNDAELILLGGLFGPERKLYKRVAQFSCLENPDVHKALARRPFEFLVHCAAGLCSRLSETLGSSIAEHEILVDAPPAKLEVQFHVDVRNQHGDGFRPLAEVSPVVQTLATRQFDDYVKRVRIFACPELARRLTELSNLDEIIAETVVA